MSQVNLRLAAIPRSDAHIMPDNHRVNITANMFTVPKTITIGKDLQDYCDHEFVGSLLHLT